MTALALFLRYWREAAIVACLTFGILECRQRDAQLIAKGEAIQAAKGAEHLLATALPLKTKAETALVHDTLRVSRLLIAANVDTAWRTDTLRLAGDTTLRAAVPLATVARWDSLGRSCSALAHDCAAFRQWADTVISALNARNAALLAQPPPSRVRWFAGGLAVGRASCYVRPPRPFP